MKRMDLDLELRLDWFDDDDVTSEYYDDYIENDVEDYGISYEDYAESRTMEDYWGE